MTPTLGPLGVLAVLLLVVTLGYSITCAIWPFRPCRSCQGTGKHRAQALRMVRLCARCDATGLKLRAGRHVWNYLRRHHTSRTQQRRTTRR